jgi:hypothetical protein
MIVREASESDGQWSLTTLELTAPLMFPLAGVRMSLTNVHLCCTHKLIVIANETLRLYEPSTLFDTQALK